MLDHVGVEVSDLECNRSFYEQALAPLGLKLVMEPMPGVAAGIGSEFPFYWIAQRGRDAVSGAHVAFRAESREAVGAFHAASLAPGHRTTERRGSARSTTPALRRLRARPKRQQHRGRAPRLPQREQDVTRLVLRGESTATIADRLVVCAHTVQQHLKSIFERTGVHSRRDRVGKVFFSYYEPRLRDNESRVPQDKPLRGGPMALD